jgi:hypothetical protein
MEMPNVAAAALGSFALVLAYVVLSIGLLRPLLMRLLPAPGQGPTKKQQVEGFWCALVPSSALTSFPVPGCNAVLLHAMALARCSAVSCYNPNAA